MSGNILLHNATERVFVGDGYGEQHLGVFLIRGENILLLGEYTDCPPEAYPGVEKRPILEVLSKQREVIENRRNLVRLKKQMQRDFGLLEADIMADFD